MKSIWRIITYTKQLWPYYLTVSGISILVAVVGLLVPMLSGRAIDAIQTNAQGEVAKVVWLAIGIFALDVASTFLSNIGGYYGDQMGVRLQRTLSHNYYQHLLSLPQDYFDTELSGKIINRLNRSITQITNFMLMWSNNFLQFIFSTIFALGIIAYYSWPIAILLASLYPIYIYMTVKTSGKWQKYQAKINLNTDIASGRFAESISQIKVVKSFIQEKRELSFFSKYYDTIVKTVQPQSHLWHKRDVQRRLVLNVIFLGVYLLIFVQAVNGHFSTGQAVALILYAMQIRIPIFTISFLVENTQRAVADSKDYFEVMNLEPQISDNPDAKTMKVTKGEIEFDHVTFSYRDKKVIKDISLKIAPDTKVALVGESGEGKTTLTNLLLRLYEPQEGSIFIDSQDINHVSQQSLRRNIGVVFQDPALFSGTIFENIAYANSKATMKDVVAAAKAANADEFVSKLEKGYDTEIGERGLKLSGGQKQRIAIARALLKDAPILVLDEATSSLDSKSEHMVQDALQHLMKGRTTIIIAHRLSTIQNVDQIITLQNGTVAEIGSPDELAKSGGIYDQLLKLQQGKTDANKKKLKAYELN
ncbi:MAG: ATP-binding cassette, subfamily bacterial [Patescibacteria group bacterium]|nr:ATP-binding cassette, subfamily bacterial [Patescibacteria group bacterium]